MSFARTKRCDLLIRNGCLLTMDVQRTAFWRGAIAVIGHSIAAVGREGEILKAWWSP
jgi:hypothetical protein